MSFVIHFPKIHSGASKLVGTYMTYTTGGMPVDFGAWAFSASGLTVGSTGPVVGSRGESPEVLVFSSTTDIVTDL